MFFKKKKQQNPGNQSKIIIGMIPLNNNNAADIKLFKRDFKKHFDNSLNDLSGKDNSFAFKIDNELVAVGHIPTPITHGDIESTARYAYNWGTALEDLINHKSHLIVTVMNGGHDQLKRFKIFTKVICSLLRTTDAVGVYKGFQSLLIPKQVYLSIAEGMSDDFFPLNLWIYFGYRITKTGNSGYTYGLKEFDKHEIEIVDSAKIIGEIEKFLYNMTHYILERDISFKEGQTCGMSADEMIPITFSKGLFVGGETFKLAY